MNPGRSAFSSGGVASPPTRVTSTGDPHGVSLSLPPSSPPSELPAETGRVIRPERGEEEPAEEPEEAEEDGGRDRDTPWGSPVEVTRVRGDATPPEENADLPGFTPERAHLLLQVVYGDFPHHNDGSPLDRGIADDTAWQRSWRRLAAQSASWYATPSGAVGRRFTAILAAEWRGVLDRSWNSERPLAFAHAMLTKTLGVAGPRRSGQGSPVVWTSGRGVIMLVW